MPPATAALLTATVAAFLLQGLVPSLTLSLALWPLGGQWMLVPDAGFAPWQLLTYAFLHGSVMHLAFNMFGLYMFGSELERAFGTRRFVVYWFACVVAAALTQLLVLGLSGTFVPTVGASGGVFGLLLGYAMLFPHRRVMLLFPPIPMRARVFVTIYALIELTLGFTASSSGIAHFAHLGGMVGGFLLLRHWKVRALA
ncbi:MAG: rhomboid family intramembrane serine protease [Burkholderiales bacterium]|nr:rhomboid family intramembrane serine protease [Burkholderiales bacterium]GIK86209.1 MAG: rhomboid family intramembrane serine protease [Betaproteobacteria bacterium]